MLVVAVTCKKKLLLFVGLQGALGWPASRGALTVLLAHATVGMAYVAVGSQARLSGSGRDQQEPAAVVGAVPFPVFRPVTLPLIAPALAAGWLLAFTLSLDDVVIASFVSGQAGTTLPFFFSSRRRHTMSLRDWSSDVCSSDLPVEMVCSRTSSSPAREAAALIQDVFSPCWV